MEWWAVVSAGAVTLRESCDEMVRIGFSTSLTWDAGGSVDALGFIYAIYSLRFLPPEGHYPQALVRYSFPNFYRDKAQYSIVHFLPQRP